MCEVLVDGKENATPSLGVGLIRETYKVGVSFFFVILVE